MKRRFSFYGSLFLFAQNDKIIFSKTKKPIDQARKLDTIGFLKIHYLTASLRALPALNAGTLEAAILISVASATLAIKSCLFAMLIIPPNNF